MIKADEISFSSKKFLFIMLALIGTLIVDNSIVRVYDIVNKAFIPIDPKILLFSVSSSLCLLLAFIVLYYTEKIFKKHALTKVFNLERLYRIAFNSLFSLAVLIGLLIFQQYYSNHYHVSVPIFIITISYAIAAGFLIRLFFLFLSWNRTSRNWIVLLYAASVLCIAFNLVVTAITVDVKLTFRPDEIRQFVGGTMDVSAGRYQFLDGIYTASSIIAFISIWTTTALLMKYYREKLLNALATYVILAIPLFYFLISYFYTFVFRDLLIQYLSADPYAISIGLTIFLSLSKPIGGLTFAIVFWRISKTVGYEKNIRAYMIISGWGILLIFSANQANTQIVAPYPPFGLATLAILIIGAFFMLLGIYSSAALVSVNEDLRKSIRRYASESKLLGLLGDAELRNEIVRSAKNVIKESTRLERDNELDLQFDVMELRKYVEFVRSEIKKGKKNKESMR